MSYPSNLRRVVSGRIAVSVDDAACADVDCPACIKLSIDEGEPVSLGDVFKAGVELRCMQARALGRPTTQAVTIAASSLEEAIQGVRDFLGRTEHAPAKRGDMN